MLYTGHHDTWYYGVMDNGGANATMMEVARICALHRARWQRGLARRVLVGPLARPLFQLVLVRRRALGGTGAPCARACQRRFHRRQGQHHRRRHDRCRRAARARAARRSAGLGRPGILQPTHVPRRRPVVLGHRRSRRSSEYERATRDRRGQRVGGGIRRRKSPGRRHRLVVAHARRHARQDRRARSWCATRASIMHAVWRLLTDRSACRSTTRNTPLSGRRNAPPAGGRGRALRSVGLSARAAHLRSEGGAVESPRSRRTSSEPSIANETLRAVAGTCSGRLHRPATASARIRRSASSLSGAAAAARLPAHPPGSDQALFLDVGMRRARNRVAYRAARGDARFERGRRGFRRNEEDTDVRRIEPHW